MMEVISEEVSQNEAKSKKRAQVSLACTNCRGKHAACDNKRPCARCLQASNIFVFYAILSRTVTFFFIVVKLTVVKTHIYLT